MMDMGLASAQPVQVLAKAIEAAKKLAAMPQTLGSAHPVFELPEFMGV